MRSPAAAVFVLILPIAACGLMVSGEGGEDDPTNNGGASSSSSSSSSTSSGSVTFEDGGVILANDSGTSQDGAGPVDASTDTSTPPSSGNALRFNNGSYVSVGNTLAIPPDFTLEAWIRPMSFNNERYIAAKDRQGQSAGQFRLGVDNGGRLFFIMTDAGGNAHGVYTTEYRLISPAAVPTNAWTHVAVTKSGAQFALVINGAAVTNITASASFNYGGPAVDFRIAARVASDGTDDNGAFDGAIDEVRLWNVARTPAMIAASRSMAIVAPYPANLVAYFRFDEGAGTSTANARGAPNGTLVRAPAWIASGIF